MKKAIQKAIEGGYTDYSDASKTKFTTYSDILLDPLFWQALGKALGWEKYCCKDCGSSKARSYSIGDSGEYGATCDECYRDLEDEEKDLYIQNDCEELDSTGKMYKQGNIATWQYQWLRFTMHLAEGKDAESFFKDLLK